MRISKEECIPEIRDLIRFCKSEMKRMQYINIHNKKTLKDAHRYINSHWNLNKSLDIYEPKRMYYLDYNGDFLGACYNTNGQYCNPTSDNQWSFTSKYTYFLQYLYHRLKDNIPENSKFYIKLWQDYPNFFKTIFTYRLYSNKYPEIKIQTSEELKKEYVQKLLFYIDNKLKYEYQIKYYNDLQKSSKKYLVLAYEGYTKKNYFEIVKKMVTDYRTAENEEYKLKETKNEIQK